ncbi:InlB B-repeat-containing protein, partial [Streptococcus anginosus]|nr:InlB B-repeat-containing protein [Streptococcus anginosus]
TVVKAVWKKVQVSVSYDGNGGSGSMDGATVDKGSKYTVLPNGFTAPDDSQEFKAWEVDGQEVAPGTEITVNGDTVVKAVWKKVQVSVSYD